MGYLDTGRSLGTSPARHAITGKDKVEQESIADFGLRHGWTVKRDGSNGYVDTVTLSKGSKRIDVTLWAGTNNIANARTTAGEGLMDCSVPVRQRVERFIVGMECSCSPDPVLYFYERTPLASCPVHGDIS